MKCCPTCGHPIPNNEVTYALRGQQRRLYEIIEAMGVYGISGDQLAERLSTDRRTIIAQVSRINPRLRIFGLRIYGRLPGANGYRLMNLTEPLTKNRRAKNGRACRTQIAAR